jgi:hypothetical protein
MKYALTIICLLLGLNFYPQTPNSIKSHSIEVKGWEYYFDDEKESARKQFEKALKLDSSNVMAKIGLFNSIPKNELGVEDFELINNLPEDENKFYSYSDISLYLMMENRVEEEYPRYKKLKAARKKYDEQYIKFKAALTDSEFRVFDEENNVRKKGAFKNRKPVGTWKLFGYKNKLFRSQTFSKQGDTVVVAYYKPDGDVIRKEWILGIPFTNDGKKLKEVVFWQENPGKEPDYLFVSKEGFKIYDSQNPVELDSTTPDNIIQRIWNLEKETLEAVIWKNGKKVPYELCEEDGMIIKEKRDGVWKTYRWENCEKILVEN